jgi:hypothetical protein
MESLPRRHCRHLAACKADDKEAVRCSVYKEMLFYSVQLISRMLY